MKLDLELNTGVSMKVSVLMIAGHHEVTDVEDSYLISLRRVSLPVHRRFYLLLKSPDGSDLMVQVSERSYREVLKIYNNKNLKNNKRR